MLVRKKIETILSSDLNKRIFSHSFWLLSGNILSKVVLLIATVLMTQYLGKVQYGQFSIIKSTILMFAMFAGMELGITATKYISQYKNENPRKVEKIVGISTLFALIMSFATSLAVFLFSDIIAELINAPALNSAIRISSAILFFSALNGIQNGILAGQERFKELSVNMAIAGVLSAVAMIVAARIFDLRMIVIAFGTNYAMLFVLNYITLKKSFYKEFNISLFNKSNFQEIDVLWKFSLPAILAGMMVGPVTWLSTYILVQKAYGYEHLATFDIANQWRTTILFIPSALAQIALPLMSSNVGNKKNYAHIFKKNLKINFYVAIFITVIFIAASPLIVKFYGPLYKDALWPLIIMFITTGLIAVNNVIGQAIASQGKMWLGFLVNLFWAFTLVGSTFVMVSVFSLGATGLAFSYLISYTVLTAVQFIYIKSLTQ